MVIVQWQACNAEHLCGAQSMGPALPCDAWEEEEDLFPAMPYCTAWDSIGGKKAFKPGFTK